MLKDKMKTYNFWISLVSAVLLVARLIASKFNIEIDSSLVMDVTTGLCGIFVVLGIISAPQKTVTKFIDRPLENSAPTSHCEERSNVAIPVLEESSAPAGEDGRIAAEGVITSLSSRASVLAKNFETKFAGEMEQPNANKASTCDSNVERQISSSCDDVAIPLLSEEATVNSEASAPNCHCEERSDVAIPVLSEEATVNSEASAPLGEDGRVAAEGEISSLLTAPRIDDTETAVATQSEEDMGVVIEGESNANGGVNQMTNPNGGVNQMTNPNDGGNQMPNLAEFSKEQLIEIICANPQFLNSSKNN